MMSIRLANVECDSPILFVDRQIEDNIDLINENHAVAKTGIE